MKKQIAILYRLPHLTVEEFKEFYETRHVPFIIGLVPGLVRYVRNYPKDGENAPWDAMTEVWIDDSDATSASSKTETMKELERQAQKEAVKFLDLARAQFIDVDESVTPNHLLRPSLQSA